jgi:hypothetical protein
MERRQLSSRWGLLCQRANRRWNPSRSANTPRQRILFAEYLEQIEQWLNREANMQAAEILRRPMARAPGS